MKKNILILFIFFLSVILDVSFFSNFLILGYAPSFTLALVIYLSFEMDFSSVVVWVVLGGLFWDLISFDIFGTHALIFFLISFAVSFISKKILSAPKFSRPFLILGFVFLGTLLNSILLALIFKVYFWIREGKMLNNFHIFEKEYFYGAFLETIFFLLLYSFMRRVKKLFEKQMIPYIK